MVKLMKIEELRSAAELVGIKLEDAEIETSNLYALVDPEGNNVYVGKAASKARHLYEDAAGFEDYSRRTYSGFVAMMYENETSRRPLFYDPAQFDAGSLLGLLESHEWSGKPIDMVRERIATDMAVTVEEVEQILIRIHIRAGRIVGNAQFASQWEGPIGSFTDSVAAVAVYAAARNGTIEMNRVAP
ncbi:MAG TPA: hypothetical protein VN035_14925 [Microbacterium sp.]|nr:hypothetical protein [Microbacterium sp.]